jgi:hypothetical protein
LLGHDRPGSHTDQLYEPIRSETGEIVLGEGAEEEDGLLKLRFHEWVREC